MLTEYVQVCVYACMNMMMYVCMQKHIMTEQLPTHGVVNDLRWFLWCAQHGDRECDGSVDAFIG